MAVISDIEIENYHVQTTSQFHSLHKWAGSLQMPCGFCAKAVVNIIIEYSGADLLKAHLPSTSSVTSLVDIKIAGYPCPNLQQFAEVS